MRLVAIGEHGLLVDVHRLRQLVSKEDLLAEKEWLSQGEVLLVVREQENQAVVEPDSYIEEIDRRLAAFSTDYVSEKNSEKKFQPSNETSALPDPKDVVIELLLDAGRSLYERSNKEETVYYANDLPVSEHEQRSTAIRGDLAELIDQLYPKEPRVHIVNLAILRGLLGDQQARHYSDEWYGDGFYDYFIRRLG